MATTLNPPVAPGPKKNRLGLHARPAALFVQTTNKFKSSVKVHKGEQEVDGKSIMGLMMLAAEEGSTLRIVVNDELGAFAAGKRERFEGKIPILFERLAFERKDRGAVLGDRGCGLNSGQAALVGIEND